MNDRLFFFLAVIARAQWKALCSLALARFRFSFETKFGLGLALKLWLGQLTIQFEFRERSEINANNKNFWANVILVVDVVCNPIVKLQLNSSLALPKSEPWRRQQAESQKPLAPPPDCGLISKGSLSMTAAAPAFAPSRESANGLARLSADLGAKSGHCFPSRLVRFSK